MVGTHALIEPEVEFARPRVCVVDEQHRFGVRQRAALDAKGPGDAAPHALHMTATPIPRTLSLTAYGDLDATMLRELPAGRRPVKTWWVRRKSGPAPMSSSASGCAKAARPSSSARWSPSPRSCRRVPPAEEAKRLAAGELRDFAVDVLHGQMPSAKKAEAMAPLRRRRHGRARRDQRYRGRYRRPQRDGDAGRGRRALRRLAAAPAARQGGAGRARVPVHPLCRAEPESWRGAASRRWPPSATASSSPRSTWRCAARARCSVPASTGCRASASPRFPTTCRPSSQPARRCWSCCAATARSRRRQLGPLMEAARQRFGDEAVEPIPP